MVWRILENIAVLLEDDERQSVLGDIQERGANLRALLDLAGLVLLRQLKTWTSWRTWVLAIGLLPAARLAVTSSFPAAQVLYTGHLLSYPSEFGTFIIQPWIAIGAPVIAWATGFSLGHIGKRRTGSVLPLLVIFAVWFVQLLQQRLPNLPSPRRTFLESLSGSTPFNILPREEDRLIFGILSMLLLAVAPCILGFLRGFQNRRLRLGIVIALAVLCLPTFGNLMPMLYMTPPNPWGLIRNIAAIWPVVYALRPVSKTRQVVLAP